MASKVSKAPKSEKKGAGGIRPKTKSQASGNKPPAPAKQLQEIRDLLFGEQLSTVQNSIETLNSSIQQQLNALQKQLETRLQQLKSDIDAQLGELGSVTEQRDSDQSSRTAAVQDDLDTVRATLKAGLKEQEESRKGLGRDLSREITQLGKEIERRHRDAMKKLDTVSKDLKANKADRKTLATLLASMANNLDGEPE